MYNHFLHHKIIIMNFCFVSILEIGPIFVTSKRCYMKNQNLKSILFVNFVPKILAFPQFLRYIDDIDMIYHALMEYDPLRISARWDEWIGFYRQNRGFIFICLFSIYLFLHFSDLPQVIETPSGLKLADI